MLLILLSWVLILTFAIVVGVSVNRLLKLQEVNPVLVIFHGFFTLTLLAGCWAIFAAIDWKFFIFLLIVLVCFIFTNHSLIINYLTLFKQEFQKTSNFVKIILAVILVLILAQSASAPSLLDNESYYIQTIAWLNEFGLVNGLINLHLF